MGFQGIQINKLDHGSHTKKQAVDESVLSSAINSDSHSIILQEDDTNQ
jgi:hypothetical protein